MGIDAGGIDAGDPGGGCFAGCIKGLRATALVWAAGTSDIAAAGVGTALAPADAQEEEEEKARQADHDHKEPIKDNELGVCLVVPIQVLG